MTPQGAFVEDLEPIFKSRELPALRAVVREKDSVRRPFLSPAVLYAAIKTIKIVKEAVRKQIHFFKSFWYIYLFSVLRNFCARNICFCSRERF